MHSLIASFEEPFVGFMLKLLAGIATAVFGIIGLGRNVRKRGGALTPKGRMALIEIIVAAVLASGSGIYDYFSSPETAKEERLKSEAVAITHRIRKCRIGHRGVQEGTCPIGR